jgi:hypothetical protein
MVTESGNDVAKMSIKVGTGAVKFVGSVDTIESDTDSILCLRRVERSDGTIKFVLMSQRKIVFSYLGHRSSRIAVL